MMEDKKEAMKRVIDKAKNAIQMPIPGKPGFPRPFPKPIPGRPGFPGPKPMPIPGKPGFPRPFPKPIPGKPGFPRPKPIMPGEKKEVIERVIYKARNA